MKNLLLLTLLSVVTFGATIQAENTLGNVVKASAKYVVDNPVKTVIAAVVVYDIYKNGLNESVAAKGYDFVVDGAKQLAGNGHLFVADMQALSKSVNSVVSKVVGK